MVRAGRLRHRVTVEQVAETRDEVGGVIQGWTAFATRYASVTPLTGREYFASRQESAEVTHEIRLRYLAGVTPKMRASYDGRAFDIESVIDVDERGRETLLMAREVV